MKTRLLRSMMWSLVVLLSAALPNHADLVAHWGLNETSGTTAVDSSANGLDGAYQGGVTLGIASVNAGLYGTAVAFDGTDGEVFKSTTPLLNNLTTDFTVAAWINPNDLVGQQLIFGSAADQWAFGLNGGSGLRFTTHTIDDFDLNVSIPVGSWTHVAVAFDASNIANFFVNGSYVASVAGSGNPSLQGSGNWFIGSRGFGATYFDGGIDEVRVYDTELTESQIAGLAAIPEPSTLAFLGLAGLLLGRVARRRTGVA